MTQREEILCAVRNMPGLTATGYTRMLFPDNKSTHKPPTVLRELQRFVKQGTLVRKLEPGMRQTVKAWRFYTT